MGTKLINRADGRWAVRVLLSAVVLAGAGCSARPQPAAAAGAAGEPTAGSGAEEAVQLVPGEPIRRQLAAGETHSYRLLPDGPSYLRAQAEQRGIDLALTLHGPGGEPVKRVDGPGGRWVEELLSAVTATGGEHRLEVTGERGGSGSYVLVVQELRPAVPADELRLTAEILLQEGTHLRAQATAVSAQEALERFGAARALFVRIDDPRGTAEALYGAAETRLHLGALADALSGFREALPLAERVADSDLLVKILGGLAWAVKEQGAEGWQPAARGHLEEALQVATAAEDPALQGYVLNHLGTLDLQGDPQSAGEYFERALPLLEAAGDQRLAALALSNLAIVQRWRGDVAEAFASFERALELARRTDFPDLEAALLSNLGIAYRQLGRSQKALEALTEALPLAQATGDRATIQRILTALGATYSGLGEYDRAVEYYQQSLELNREMGRAEGEALALMQLGWMYEALGETERALELFHGSLERSDEQPSPTRAYAVQGIGRCLLSQGRAREALARLDDALRLHGLNHTGRISVLLDLAEAHREQGDLDRALERSQEALTVSRELADPGRQAWVLFQLAELARRRGQLTAALAQVEEALAIAESLRGQVPGLDLRASFSARWQDVYELAIEISMTLAAEEPASDHAAVALAMSERARARSLVELLAEASMAAEIDPELRRREMEIQARLTGLQDRLRRVLAAGETDGSEVEDLRRKLAEARTAQEDLELAIRLRNRRYADVRYPAPLTLSEIQELLDDRTALLEYSLGVERSFLFVVTRDGLVAHVLPPAEEIAGHVFELRQAVIRPGRRLWGQLTAAARQLYEILVAPAAAELEAVEHLLIAPDRDLYLLPFEALLRRDERSYPAPRDAYLIDRWSVTYTPSASVLASLRPEPSRPRRTPSRTFVAFADPWIEETPETGEAGGPLPVSRSFGLDQERWRRLPGSRQEVEAIARLFPADRVELYLDTAAREEEVKNSPLVAGAGLLHFATHGFLDEEEPAYSGLVLAAGSAGEDGLLQMHEIFDLHLSAELVVLSACETGLGRRVRGEGLVGISRAFMYAGAPATVLSLWRVEDRSSAALMTRFYRHLVAGDSKREALRSAKLELLDDRWSHPAEWAGFILLGMGGQSLSETVTRGLPGRP